MSGFQTRNVNNAVVLDSELSPIYYYDRRDYGSAVIDWGSYEGNTPLGNINQLVTPQGVIMQDSPGLLRWIRLNEGKRALPTASQYDRDAGTVVRTTADRSGVRSGYLDIFNAQGQLIWSAVQAQSVPRILGSVVVPAGFDLWGSFYSHYVGFSPFILESNCFGTTSVDGETLRVEGIMLRYDSGYIRVAAVDRGASSGNFRKMVNRRGISIPYAVFSGI